MDYSLPIPTQIFNLRKLHRILEIYALVKSYIIGLTNETIRTILSGLVAHFKSIEIDEASTDAPLNSSAMDVEDSTAYTEMTTDCLNEPLRLVSSLPRYSGGTTKIIQSITKR